MNETANQVHFSRAQANDVIDVDSLDMFLTADFGKFYIDGASEELFYKVDNPGQGIQVRGHGWRFEHCGVDKKTKAFSVLPQYQHLYPSYKPLYSVPIAAPIDRGGSLCDLLLPLKRKVQSIYGSSEIIPSIGPTSTSKPFVFKLCAKKQHVPKVSLPFLMNEIEPPQTHIQKIRKITLPIDLLDLAAPVNVKMPAHTSQTLMKYNCDTNKVILCANEQKLNQFVCSFNLLGANKVESI